MNQSTLCPGWMEDREGSTWETRGGLLTPIWVPVEGRGLSGPTLPCPAPVGIFVGGWGVREEAPGHPCGVCEVGGGAEQEPFPVLSRPHAQTPQGAERK